MTIRLIVIKFQVVSETQSGGIVFNDTFQQLSGTLLTVLTSWLDWRSPTFIIQCMNFHLRELASQAVRILPWSANNATDTEPRMTDGYQVMKHTYDTFTQLRSSIDMPKE